MLTNLNSLWQPAKRSFLRYMNSVQANFIPPKLAVSADDGIQQKYFLRRKTLEPWKRRMILFTEYLETRVLYDANGYKVAATKFDYCKPVYVEVTMPER